MIALAAAAVQQTGDGTTWPDVALAALVVIAILGFIWLLTKI